MLHAEQQVKKKKEKREKKGWNPYLAKADF